MAEVIDQSNTVAGDSWGFNDVALHRASGQGFTPSLTAKITKVELSLKKSGSPTGTLTLKIYADSGSDLPDNATLIADAAATVAESSLTTSFAYYAFDLVDTLLNSGTKYWWKLTDNTADGTNLIFVESGGASSTYPGGTGAQMDTSNAWAAQTDDFLFKEYYDDTTVVVASGGLLLSDI